MSWVIIGAIVLAGISFALGQEKERRRKKAEKEASERDQRERKKREDTDKNRGARIKNALERHNAILKSKFDVTGGWSECSGYEINVYRIGADSRKVNPILVVVDSRRGPTAIRIWRTAPVPQEFSLDEGSIERAVVVVKNHMDVMSL